MSGMFLEDMGEMAIEWRCGGVAKSPRMNESELLFLEELGSGGIKFVHSREVWTFLDWNAS